jgi:hypothetical protein
VGTVADTLSRLDIHSLKIQEEERKEKLALQYRIDNPNVYCLDLQRTSKIQGTRIKRKEVSPIS